MSPESRGLAGVLAWGFCKGQELLNGAMEGAGMVKDPNRNCIAFAQVPDDEFVK